MVLSGLLFPLAIVAVTPHHDPKPYYAWLLVLQAGCIGVFCALDLFVFFVMFEIVLVPMYFLIGGWGYAERVYAALKFFIYTMLGSALMLVGIVSLAFLHHDGVRDELEAERQEIQATAQAADRRDRRRRAEPRPERPRQPGHLPGALRPRSTRSTPTPPAQLDALGTRRPHLRPASTIAESQDVQDTSTSAPTRSTGARPAGSSSRSPIAFAVKVPLFPLHTWLPDAHTQAPTAGSVILAGVMLKLGTYGFLRFGLYLFPEATVWFAPGMVTLGVIGIIYGAIVATMQKDLKRLVAYSSVAHLGFIVLGTFALTTQGIQGGVLQMVNHGISTGALFLLVGMIYDRRHTREIAALKGLQKSAPILAGGVHGRDAQLDRPARPQRLRRRVPDPRRLVPHHAVVDGGGRGRRDPRRACTCSGPTSASSTASPTRTTPTSPTSRWREGLVMAPLLGLIVFLGVYPKPVLERIEPAVDRLVTHIEDHSDYRQPEVATGTGDDADEPTRPTTPRTVSTDGAAPRPPVASPLDEDPAPIGRVDVAWSALAPDPRASSAARCSSSWATRCRAASRCRGAYAGITCAGRRRRRGQRLPAVEPRPGRRPGPVLHAGRGRSASTASRCSPRS